MTNSPSDGVERPVADGLFVYSTAPTGPPVRLIARPNVVRTVPGAAIALRVTAVDAFYHATESAGPVNVSVAPEISAPSAMEFSSHPTPERDGCCCAARGCAVKSRWK